MASLVKYKETNPSNVKTIIKAFYSASYAASIEVNDEVVELVWKMVSSSKHCTKLLNLVPRPAGFIPGASYIAIQLASLSTRLVNAKNNEISHTCKAFVTNAYSTKIKLASLGI